MKHEDKQVKNISWELNQKKYTIHNVPFHVYKKYSSEEVYDSEVTIKLFLLKDLMEAREIPQEVDFQESLNIALE